jgi:hypothetical protein
MKKLFISGILILLCLSGISQQIRLINKLDGEKTRTLRIDKSVTIKTFDGDKASGEWKVLDEEKILVGGLEIKKDNIMMISGFVQRDSRDKAVGLGLTIGAGILFPVAVYYILGGIAWGFSNGIFVGVTILFFDLLLAYAGTNRMGIIPRRFSTLNWEIDFSDNTVEVPIQIPIPND